MSRRIRHYPTPITTSYYIGQYLIDDMFRVDFTRKVTDQPIWGYASKQFDFVAKGREIVTGNIIINFRYPGYLTNVIKSRGNTAPEIAALHAAGLLDQKTGYVESGYENILEKGSAAVREVISALADFDNIQSNEAKMQKLSNILLNNRLSDSQVGKIIDLNSKRPNMKEASNIVDELKKSLNKRHLGQLPTNEEDVSIKAMESPLSDGIKNILFDLSVQYGFQGIAGGWRRTFKDIVLLGESQVAQAGGDGSGMGSSAQSFLEIYPFFCRTIKIERYYG